MWQNSDFGNMVEKLNPTIKFELGNGAYVEFRRSGTSANQSVSFVYVDANGTTKYCNILDSSGQFLPGLANTYRILSYQTVSVATKTTVGDKEIWTDLNGTINSVSGATDYILIPQSCNFGLITSIKRNGTAITANAINVSGGTHSCTAAVLVLAVKNTY